MCWYSVERYVRSFFQFQSDPRAVHHIPLAGALFCDYRLRSARPDSPGHAKLTRRTVMKTTLGFHWNTAMITSWPSKAPICCFDLYMDVTGSTSHRKPLIRELLVSRRLGESIGGYGVLTVGGVEHTRCAPCTDTTPFRLTTAHHLTRQISCTYWSAGRGTRLPRDAQFLSAWEGK
jgi:hypothetical protein